LNGVAGEAFAQGKAVSASNPEAILPPHPSIHYSVFNSVLNRMRDAKLLFPQEDATSHDVGDV
jgi:hypothetical protein